MLSFAWHRTGDVEPERTYTALLGCVQLARVSLLPKFAWSGVQIVRQLERTSGVVGYRTAGKMFAMTFLHLSAWRDSTSIQAFVQGQPHQRIMEELFGRLGKIEFRYWTIKGSDLPLVFDRELHRLDHNDRLR